MKHILLVLLLISPSVVIQAQEPRLVCKTTGCSMSGVDTNLNRLHLLGNSFENAVARKLNTRTHVSLLVEHVTVSLRYLGAKGFQLTYTAKLTPAEGGARHFARLGTIRGARSLAAARSAVAADNRQKKARLKKLYGIEPTCSSDDTKVGKFFWVIEDCFVTDN